MSSSTPVLEHVVAKLGGAEVLGIEASSEADLARLVQRGLPLAVLDQVEAAGFSKLEIDRLIIPHRTRSHRKNKRQPLSLDESDRVVRLLRIQSLAEDVFAEPGNASRWLREPLRMLDDKAPLELARSESGARLLKQLLATIDSGAAA